MTDDLDSSSKGIWILPYEPTDDTDGSEAGPSRNRARPLKRAYDQALQSYNAAHEAYEEQRSEEQLDGISDWLERSLTSTKGTRFHRLPLGIIQQPGSRLLRSLEGVERTRVLGIHGRDMVDLQACVKSLTTGFLPDTPAKSGLTGLDKIENWWKGLKDSPSILIHVQDAQIVNPAVLAEFMYILTLHPDLPVRLLLSVPSIRTFLSQWSTIELSSIDLTILTSTRSRRRQNAVSAILDSVDREGGRGIKVGEELSEKLRADEKMYGAGPQSALRALQWSMLHHEANSPLATLLKDDRSSEIGAVQAVLESIKADPEADIPGKHLMEIPILTDLDNVLDPSPRISILHALSNTSSYIPTIPQNPVSSTVLPRDPETPTKKSKRRATVQPKVDTQPPTASASRRGEGEGEHHDPQEGGTGTHGDIKDLEILYGLWKGAGKSVNLWDWLSGYLGSFGSDDDDDDQDGNEGGAGSDEVEVEVEVEGDEPPRISLMRKQKRKRALEEGDQDQITDPTKDDGGQNGIQREGEEEKRDRLHASFVRFCEEARMLGMVRARGKGVGRRADEVVKGVTLV